MQNQIKTLESEALLALFVGKEPAKRIIEVAGGIGNIKNLTHKALLNIKGVGCNKAKKILALLEINKRVLGCEAKKIGKIHESQDIYNCLKPNLFGINHEEFWVIYLRSSKEIIKKQMLFKGGLTSVTVDPILVFKKALELNAKAVVLAHNHPSGSREPSMADIAITNKLRKGAKLLDISLLDHIIFTDTGDFYSFADEGHFF